MAKITASVFTSHVPAIGAALDRAIFDQVTEAVLARR